MSTLHRIGEARDESSADLVFVHGLSGDAFMTWHPKLQPDRFWPGWVAADHPDVAVWTIGYEAPKNDFSFLRDRPQEIMPLFDRGTQVLDLLSHAGLGARPIIFVGHSLGGLIVKQLLRRAHDAAGANDGWSRIRENTRGVIFLATPHTGSGVAAWLKYFELVARPSINTTELVRNDAPLRDLKSWYVLNTANIETLAFYENRPLFGSVVVVDQTSADPGIGRPPVAIDADHSSIAKLEERTDHLYLAVDDVVARLKAPTLESREGLSWTLPTTLQPIGRGPLLEKLGEAFQNDAGTSILLLGAPAIGKSTLALFAANSPEAALKFGSRRCFLRLDQEGAVDTALTRQSIARSIGLPPGERYWDAVLATLREDPALLILDNLETGWEQDATGVEALLRELAGIPSLTLCVTLRGAERPAHIAWDMVLEVPRLDPEPAAQLFARISGIEDNADALVPQLLEQMDGIPLAIELIAEQCQFTPLADIWREWNARKTAMLRRSDKAADSLSNLAVSIELSFSSPRVTKAGATLFKMLGRLPAGLATRNLEPLLGEDSYSAASALRRTRLAYDRGDRIVLLSPVREYAKGLSLDDELERKIPTLYLGLIDQHSPTVGVSDTSAGIEILGDEAGNLESAVQLALSAGMIEPFLDLTSKIGDFQRFSGLGSPSILLEISDHASLSGHPAVAARAMLKAGEVYLHRSQYRAAMEAFENAHLAFAAIPERISGATCVKCIGDVLLELGRLEEARGRFCEALRGYRRARCVIGVANCWSRLGAIAIEQQQSSLAKRAVARANALYRDLPDLLGQANCVLADAKIALMEDEIGSAEAGFDTAFDLLVALGDLEGQGQAAFGRATIAEYRQDGVARHSHLHAALRTFLELQSPFWVGHAHYRLMQGAGGAVLAGHAREARKAWTSIDRVDLLELLPTPDS